MTSRERVAREAFLLTRHWRDTPDGVEIVFWAASNQGPMRLRFERQEPLFFVERDAEIPPAILSESDARRQPVELENLEGCPVDALYFRSQHQLAAAAGRLRSAGLSVSESDLKPADRFLMERFITGGVHVEGHLESHGTYVEFRNAKVRPERFRPQFRLLSLDIETSDWDGDLYSISLTEGPRARVFLKESSRWQKHHRQALEPKDHGTHLSVHPDEKHLLGAFFQWLNEYDPDVLIGWNVVQFDLEFIAERCRRYRIPFALGRGRDPATILPASGPTQKTVARIPGRVVLDGIDVLRAATWIFEDFRLEAVARELLGRGKLIEDETGKLAEIRRLYREAPDALVAYNLEDCRLAEAVFEEARLIDFALERTELTGLNLDRVGGSAAAFDHLYLPRLHRRGYVAPDVTHHGPAEESPGGYLIDSKPGLYQNVLVLDFKSLYPSIIRTFKIDPLGMKAPGADRIPGFRGASFSRDQHILPDLIAELWNSRDEAKAKRDAPLSRAIKIIMNSFYGVLGSTGCRFFDPRLASSITLRGHDILTRSWQWIEAQGHSVIYGDTDSLFVLMGPGPGEREAKELGGRLASALNSFWSKSLTEEHGVESFLEVQFETHYLRFFMPTIRGSEEGSKKRYAGLVRRGNGFAVRFVGLEAVRSDWTPLARRFQRELFRRVFQDEPFEGFIRETAEELRAGQRDHELAYRKRLRRRLEDYRKNVPPHVQAARKSKRPGRWVSYIVTRNGPEPTDNNPSPPDYEHYVDRQLAPAADALLQLKGTSVKKILDLQMSLF
jgi:DNA polymerase-2